MGQGLGLSDVTQGIDVIFLAETWEHDTKHIPMIYVRNQVPPDGK